MATKVITGREYGIWRAIQWVGLAAMLILIGGLFARAEIALDLMWNVIIPLVPASLLISPMLWRNSCPLATLNQLTNRLGPGGVPGGRVAAFTAGVGILLLAILVPARRFLFNADGAILAVTIIVVAVAALIMGAAFDMKAGFCNAFCPILPVERLYGQRPLLEIPNARCPTCTRCSRACIDLTVHKAIPQLLGRARNSSAWLGTPFGAFAGAFPGFVLAYFMAVDSPLESAGFIYFGALTLAGASYLATVLAVRAFNLHSSRVLPTLAALAAGLYYWFAGPSMAEAVGAGGGGGAILRTLALALVVGWWWNARRVTGRVRPSAQRVPQRGAHVLHKPDRGEA